MPDQDEDITGGEPKVSASKKKVTCEFCNCDLLPSGDLRYDLSPEAKKFRDAKRNLDAASEKITTLMSEASAKDTMITELRSKIAEFEAKISALPATERPATETPSRHVIKFKSA